MTKTKRLRKYKKGNKELIEDTIEINKMNAQEEEMAQLKDDDLFVINEGKSEEIKKNRDKLAADRFKLYNKERSKNERDKIKELIRKQQKSKDEQPKPKTKTHSLVDLWNTPAEELGIKKLRKAHNPQDNIKRVVIPHTGHSYNPPAAEHKKLIDQVVLEEIEDIRKERKLMEELNPDLRPEAKDLPERIAKLKQLCVDKEDKMKKKRRSKSKKTEEPEVEPAKEAESDDEDGPTKLSVNPPVDRKNALTPWQRKMRKIEKEMKKQKLVEKKMRQRAHKNRPLGKKQLKALRRIKNYKKQLEELEKEKWEKEGVVSQPRKLGLYKYQKSKIEFVPEEELPEAFRKQKGTDALVLDQFDSFYRRNLLPKDAPPNDRKKIKGTQYKSHKSNEHKKMIRDQEKKGDRATQLAREKLRERKRRTALIRGLKAPTDTKEDDEEIIAI